LSLQQTDITSADIVYFAACKSWGLAKTRFSRFRKRDESGGCPFAIIFFAIWEEVEEWRSLTRAFYKPSPNLFRKKG